MSQIEEIINQELKRQQNHIELIASENFTSPRVMAAVGSVLTNKYAEGYPGKRYYGGCEFVDEIEILAQNYCKKLFNIQHVNVQPHSGSQANQAVFMAFLKPGDTILSMSLDCGGHLTHGHKKTMSGAWFNIIHYGVNKDDFLINYNDMEIKALEHKPKLIITGFSAYSRHIDWQKCREIADKVGAILMADIAHVAGLIATGFYPSPVGIADVITSTTHKTLRGPRGGIIMTNNENYAKKIDSALFPGIQGGPLMHIIAGKAVSFEEALTDEFKEYQKQVLKNSRSLAKSLIENKIDVLTNGTDNHIVLVDCRKYNISGLEIQIELEKIGIISNKNSMPFDPLPPTKTSGIRLGSPACTTRGMKEKEFIRIGEIISEVIFNIVNQKHDQNEKFKSEVLEITKKFPIYS